MRTIQLRPRPELVEGWAAGCTRASTSFFFFNDTATTETYTLSLHDALPICGESRKLNGHEDRWSPATPRTISARDKSFQAPADRKSTRLNSSHSSISYA